MLTTPSLLTTYSGVDYTTAGSSGQATTACLWATAMIESYCDRSFDAKQYVETKDGSGRDTLVLANRPVSGVVSVTIDGTDYTDFTLDAGKGYLYHKCHWPLGRRNIVVSYTAGYATVPADLEAVATSLALDLIKSAATNSQMKSETLWDYQYTRADNTSMLSPYMGVLAFYRRMA